MPTLASFNESLFVVYAGYQDYFFSLYDKSLTIKQTKNIVPDVVKAIEQHIVVLTHTSFPLNFQFSKAGHQFRISGMDLMGLQCRAW